MEDFKPHPESMTEKKVTQISPHRRMGTKDRIYKKMGAIWAADSKLKK